MHVQCQTILNYNLFALKLKSEMSFYLSTAGTHAELCLLASC